MYPVYTLCVHSIEVCCVDPLSRCARGLVSRWSSWPIETHRQRSRKARVCACSSDRAQEAACSSITHNTGCTHFDFSPFIGACESLASMRDVIAPLIAALVLETHLLV